MRTLIVSMAMVLTGLVSVGQAQKFDLTGEWTFDVQTDAGTGTPVFTLKQDGEKVTGRYKGTLGEADVTGTVSVKTFKLTFSGDAQGTAITVTYDGEFESATTVKGKLDLAGMATGTFTGKKTK